MAPVVYKADALNLLQTSDSFGLLDGSLVCMKALVTGYEANLHHTYEKGSTEDRHRLVIWLKQQLKTLWSHPPVRHDLAGVPNGMIFQAVQHLGKGGQAAVCAVQRMKPASGTGDQLSFVPDTGNILVLKICQYTDPANTEYAAQELALLYMVLGPGECWK